MGNFKAWVEETRAGNFLVRHRDQNGNKFTDYHVEKSQRMAINGEEKTGKWLANELRERVMAKYYMKQLGEFDLSEKLAPLVESYLSECESLSLCTYRHYEISLRRFLEETHAVTLSDLSKDLITDWKLSMARLKNSTIRGRLADLRMFLNWLVRNGKIESSPFGEKIMPSEKRKEPQFYTRAEFKTLDDALAEICPMTQLGCNLAHDMGLRKVEFVGDGHGRSGAMWEDIIWRSDGKADLVLRNEVVKGQDHGRLVRITPGVLALLGSRKSGPLVTITRCQFDHRFQNARRQAGIKATLDVHGLRDTFAKNYLQSGEGNLASLKELLGHTDISTTQIYAKFEKSYLDKGVELAYERRKQEEALLAPRAGVIALAVGAEELLREKSCRANAGQLQ